MDKRQENLRSLKVCRFCLTPDEVLIPLYGIKKAPKNSVPFALKILSCISIEVFPSDHTPKYICNRCKLFMELGYAFKQLCRQADEVILEYIQKGSPLTAVPWSSQLTKAYKACSKSEMSMVKTVVQGGATVKVMAEECSDSEEGEDDNVYNVKIGDGSEEGKSIKIITTVDKQEHVGAKGRQIKQNIEDEEAIEADIVQGCWPCDECECNYPLEQLLTLHKAQKHRTRSEVCEECDGRFYNKYDLEAHRATHVGDLPFQCVICSKKFKRLILLKRHEKTMHSDCPQLSCSSCPATFLSPEELEGHQLKHERGAERAFACFCGKSFLNNQLLARHTAMVHRKKSAFSCQYCPEQFPSISKLTRHVREHAGEKPYPCKYCDKNFTKSHHYTRHLRLKHSNIISASNVYTEAYSCDECSEKFSTQDELMYHSALHATRNLTCPLCQEKFDDVDTVTAHIKSHVNGTEFMCDFCELIFTTKEKLDAHMAKVHEDELMAMEQETEPDESSMDMEAEEEDEDASLDVKEQNGEMVVEIKKPDEYMLPAQPDEDKADNTQSEDSEINYGEMTSGELEIIPIVAPKQADIANNEVTIAKPAVVTPFVPKTEPVAQPIQAQPTSVKASPILRKAEDVKRKAMVLQQTEKKDKPKVESSTSTGTSDKSLRLLEKELQDLKRTNSRSEAPKTPVRASDSIRTRRPQMFSSTPKNRNGDKKESIQKQTPEKSSDKKQPERKTKDTKEPKEKSNNNTSKDDRELKGSKEEKDGKVKEEKEKGKEESRVSKEEIKGKEEKETKNREDKQKDEKREAKNTSESTASATEDPSVRRSTRPSKVKDYAKMIRDSSMNSDEEEDTDAEDEEDYKEDKTPDVSQSRGRGRGRVSGKPPPAPAPKPCTPASKADTPLTVPRKRGRPRKEPKTEVPNKIKKDEPSNEDEDVSKDNTCSSKDDAPKENQPDNADDGAKTPTPDASKQSEPRPGVIMSPSGQTLKKVPIKALPPGVKALPLPGNSARIGGGEVTEMQIGKKIVKVQKIVMTKAEVEAMTKKGLLEIKDGTMVLKQGIKLPTSSDPVTLKTSFAAECAQNKESPSKQTDKQAAAGPTRCDDA